MGKYDSDGMIEKQKKKDKVRKFKDHHGDIYNNEEKEEFYKRKKKLGKKKRRKKPDFDNSMT